VKYVVNIRLRGKTADTSPTDEWELNLSKSQYSISQFPNIFIKHMHIHEP